MNAADHTLKIVPPKDEGYRRRLRLRHRARAAGKGRVSENETNHSQRATG
jgi:hypothetical protein